MKTNTAREQTRLRGKGNLVVRLCLAALSTVGIGLAATSCSLIVDTNSDQCAVDADCKGDLDGRTFTVTFPTEDKKPKEKLVFKDGKLTLTSLGDLEITYKAQVKANWKHEVSETAFSGTAKAADGAQIEIQGNAMLDGEIRGSITRREKDVDATARNFNGKQTGAQQKKK